VAVFGCGPVGIMAQKAAWLQGAGRVLGIDLLDYRLKIAARVARAEPVNASKEDPVDAIRRATGGRGADLCVDAVGIEADRNVLKKLSAALHAQRGSMKVLSTAISSVRRSGTISILGVYGTPFDNFPLGQLFDKGITLRMGQAPVHRHIDRLLDLVRTHQVRLDDVITHTLGLENASEAYAMFNDKTEDCLKVVLKP
jgi:alcohol dehydrogenase